VAAAAVSKELSLGGVAFQSQDLALDDLSLAILETRDYLCRRFMGPERRQFDLLIVFSADNRKGTHPPDVCLEGSGEEPVSKQVVALAPAGMRGLQMKELVTQRGTRLTYHLYVYKCGRSYTPSFFWQQFTIFANGLLARNSAGALIHFTVPIAGADPQPARELALAAAQQVLPQIDRGMP
jgi:EpsI family protein